MADVRPLQGIRYVSQKIGDLAEIITPPYDVISEEDQARYYQRSPYNIIRLELGRDEAHDTSLNNRYSRAAATLAEWRLQDILREDTTPRYYCYQQVFTYADQTYTRSSLLARVRLEPWSARVVLPHERTMAKPKSDRLKLMQACAANLSPIMSLYDDPQGRMRKLLGSYAANAEIQVSDEVQEEHRLQPIAEEEQIALIQSFFAERPLYIADGHHRYETALNYRDELQAMRKRLHADDAVNFVLMALIDIDDPGLLVLPTHRLISNLGQDALDALNSQQLGKFFTVRELAMGGYPPEAPLRMLAQAGEVTPAFVICAAEQSWLVSLNEQGRAYMQQSGHSAAWNALDVAVAHTLVVEELLGLGAADLTSGTHVRYTRDARQALQAVQHGEAQVALLLNPTRVRQVCDVAEAGDLMPQKSTYFYPKLITGLVINPLW
ncbi:MAG TPA: DUF1015 domain-containing protein [Ktedonobacteraceae bacterium]|nr:DUF1015 domain-containing protein [Ktedonobacteraceae bacterium]